MSVTKTCYFYWGNETISFMRYMTIKSFIFHNPTFETILIIKKNPTKIDKKNNIFEEQQDDSYFTGKDYTKELNELDITKQTLEDDYPEIAKLNLPDSSIDDILGWYILGNKGGFKSDMDILFTKPIDTKLFENIDLTLFTYYGNFAIGFLYGEPNKLFKAIYELSKHRVVNNYQAIGGTLLNEYIMTNGNHYNYNIRLMQNLLVYPFIYLDEWHKQLDIPWKTCTNVPPENIGIHWYGGWKTSREFNNNLTKENYKNFRNTITYYIEQILKND